MGSLCPTFVSARLVGLAVKLTYANAFCRRFPSVLSEPLDASVTFSEATAPVKLPTRHCPPVLLRLEPKTTKGGISRTTPSRLASQLQSLPPILHMTVPRPIPGYSKAPRGLFVLPQVARVFTGTVISPRPPSRQWPSRSTIHAGRNLPDKGLRYLRHVVTHLVSTELREYQDIEISRFNHTTVMLDGADHFCRPLYVAT